MLDDGTATDLITGELLSSQDIEDRLDAMWDFYMETNDEDIVACESVQQGVQIEQYMGKVFKISKNEKKEKKEKRRAGANFKRSPTSFYLYSSFLSFQLKSLL